uniref:Uncharacterized protein n=1 Tax=Anguilla anguilla TaxID=7936 RepID=A0A0E9VJR0_ANGAN
MTSNGWILMDVPLYLLGKETLIHF